MAKDIQPMGGRNFDLANATPETRLGSREKQFLDSLLNRSVEEGYLELDEYEQRLEKVLRAKTVGEAEGVLADLPAYQQLIAGGVETGKTPVWIKWVWFGLAIPMGIVSSIWLVIFLLTGNLQLFWPLWVIMPLGVVGTALTIAERVMIRPWWAEEQKKKRVKKLRRRFDNS